MIEITVGYVAGFIAAAIFTVRIWVPTILNFVLSGVLRDKNSAATWSVAGRSLQQSYWPMILSSDTSRNHEVRPKVVIVTSTITFMSIVIAVAGIVTPLGLYEALEHTKPRVIQFQYLKDSSPFGFGTPPRSNLTFNRKCVHAPCPFSDSTAVVTMDNLQANYNFTDGYNITIPDVIHDSFSSGTSGNTTISNFFDIQWRRYATTSDDFYNNGSVYLLGAYRQMSSMVLNDAIEPVEGLIVDTVNGGIGLRNHTVPLGSAHGSSWSEDILFIEPETECVNTNITIDFSITPSQNFSKSVIDTVLTDRGGFVNLNLSFPRANLTDTQGNADLRARAYKAAWMMNVYTMWYYNISNPHNNKNNGSAFAYLKSKIGQQFSLPLQGFGSMDAYNSLGLDSSFNSHLEMGQSASIGNNTSPEDSGPPSNPFGLASLNFTSITVLCSGAGGQDYANISNIFVNCGLMRGIPQRQGGGSNLIFEGGSRWSQPLYSCATAVKATIKTVEFSYNGTSGFKGLSIKSVQNKKYTNDAAKPLWGVENTGNSFRIGDISLLWGLVSDAWQANPNISFVRQESLYLPGAGNLAGLTPRVTSYNLPASEFYHGAGAGAYTVDPHSGTPVDYSGSNNMAMWARWQELSKSPVKAALIPNLIFTDYATGAVVGTKGVLGPGNTATSNQVDILVSPTVMRIKYHYAFAIPAFIVLLGALITTAVAIVSLTFGDSGIAKMRRHLKQSATGRVLTTFLYPEERVLSLKEKEWSERFGKVEVDMSGERPGVERIGEVGKGASITEYERDRSRDRSTEGTMFLGGR